MQNQTFKDVSGNLLKEGFYIRTDRALGTCLTSNLIYISRKDEELYQESLESLPRPLEVSDRTTFQPLSKRDIDWLKRRF